MNHRWGLATCIIFLCLALTCPKGIAAAPKSFSFELFISINASDNRQYPLSGSYDIVFELINNEPSHPSYNTVVFSKPFSSTITQGILTVTIEEDDNLNLDLFSNTILKSKLTFSNKFQNEITPGAYVRLSALADEDSIEFNFHSIAKVMVSKTSKYTRSLLNKNLLSFHQSSLNVSVGTKNNVTRLFVDGTVRASAFLGDASRLSGISYIRWTKIFNPERIYYNEGFVGFGTNTPKEWLSVSGNMLISSKENEENTVKNNPLLTVRDSLYADFTGDAPQISSLNAINISTGKIPNPQLFGNYTNIKSIGTITSATWNSLNNPILDAYVSDSLTLQGSYISGAMIQGTIEQANSVAILSQSNESPISISSNRWTLNESTNVNYLNNSKIRFGNSALEYTSTLNVILFHQPFLTLNAKGHLGFTDDFFDAKANFPNGIRIGDSLNGIPGMIRFNSTSGHYESYSNQWIRLDKGGVFTGYSLYPKDKLIFPTIQITTNGNVGFHEKNAKNNIVSSGNVIFLGNENAGDLSTMDVTFDAMAYVANKGAFRLGESHSSEMFTPSRIGRWSVGIGYNTTSSGEGAVNISSTNSNAGGDYAVLLSSISSEFYGNNSVLINTQSIETNQLSNSIILNTGASNLGLSGDNHIIFNGANLTTNYSNTYMGGWILSPSPGNDTFLWSYRRIPEQFGSGYHGSFILSPFARLGINTAEFSGSETMSVNGSVAATGFDGFGHMLTGEIKTNFLVVPVGGNNQQIYSSTETSANHIYVSDLEGILPVNSVTNTSIQSNTITGSNFEPYVLDSTKFSEKSIEGKNFDTNAIKITHLSPNSLDTRVFSNIEGNNFEDRAIDDQKIASDSIITHHFNDESVTELHILDNMINSTNMSINNIALHQVMGEDIKVEKLNSKYFANASATGTTMGHQILSTQTSHNQIDWSYFVYQNENTEPSPQIQEHHINQNNVLSKHIQPNQVVSRNLSNDSVTSIDFIPIDIESTPNNPLIITNERTASGAVFIGRHFKDNALTTRTFYDDPQENFKLKSFQIDTRSINYDDSNGDELSKHVIQLKHIRSNEIVGRHIQTETVRNIAFDLNSVFSKHISPNSITTEKIKDHTLLPSDFSPKSIHGNHLVPGTLTSYEISNKAIELQHLPKNIISSRHIINKSLTTKDFSTGAFTESKIKNSSVSSDNLSVSSITKSTIATFNLTESKLQNRAVQWSHFTPPEGPFPVEKFADNSLDLSKKFNDDFEIPGQQLEANSIEKKQLHIPTFNIEKLETPLSVSKGGTGITSFITNAILYATAQGETTAMGQSNSLLWDPTKKRLSIGQSTTSINGPGIITTGNILVDGALLLKKTSDTLYTYLKYSSNDDSIQMSSNQPLDSTESNMGLKTKSLYSKSSLGIGTAPLVNGLDLTSGLRIGENYLSNGITPPQNGLIVEGSIQIGGAVTRLVDSQNALQNKILRTNQHEDGIVAGTSDTVGVISDITNTSEFASPPKTPLQTNQRTVHSRDALIGIQTEAPNPMQIEMNAATAPPTGIHAQLKHNGSSVPAQALQVSNGPTLTSQLSTIQKDADNNKFSAGVYGNAKTIKSINYAGLFTGNFNTHSLTNQTKTQALNLSIDKVFIEGSIRHGYTPNLYGNSIDWTETHIINITVNDFDRHIKFIAPPAESCTLLIKVNHTGYGKIIWDSENIQWLEGKVPELTIIADREDIVSFYYNKTKNKYYGSAVFNFKYPDYSSL
jgi:hypothetical protein